MASEHSIHHGEPSRLAALLGRAGEGPEWGSDDLASILAHQLRAPLLFDLHRLASARGGGAAGTPPDPWADAAARQIHSFGDLLDHPTPPRELLLMTKAFAKPADEGGAPALPPEVASVLYFAAIAAALLRLGERITTLDDRAIANGLAWTLSRSWVGPELRTLLGAAARAVVAKSDDAGGGR
jgi:hypothetical protein